MYNTASNPPSPVPPRTAPKFAWPKPGEDTPRLAWPEFLRLVALQLEADYPCHGPNADPGASPGAFLAEHVIALAEQGVQLGAWDPASPVARAQEDADLEAASVQAMEAEAMAPGVWTITVIDESPGDSRRGWFRDDPESETNRN